MLGSCLNAKKDLLLNKVPWKHLCMPYAQGEEDLRRSGALLDLADEADAAGVDSVEFCQGKSVKCIKRLTKCRLGCAFEPDL